MIRFTHESSGWLLISETCSRSWKTGEPASAIATPPASSATFFSVLGRDLAVNVELGATVGAEVDVVHSLERPFELRSADRPLEREVETRALG